ncbi:unnamed protein product [Pieris macdunnoughi]|uniref:Uncharacterized protein n=1 Tax=Pieris macdunnoughi TaxID=345717 RepID=A0A821VHH6_9NEOP|nr:unnamed protein product [Pieris macdunnoughi]
MSRSKKILDMYKKTDAERPELSAPFSNVPTDYTKKSVNTDNKAHLCLPVQKKSGQELADIWEEVLHEDVGPKKLPAIAQYRMCLIRAEFTQST